MEDRKLPASESNMITER